MMTTSLLACAAPPRAAPVASTATEATEATHPAPPQVSKPPTTAPEPVPCADRRSTPDCTRQDGCVFKLHIGCRAIVDACERVDPQRAYPGRQPWPQDPCTGQNPACVFNPRTQVCQTYTRVETCPPELEAAKSLSVNCVLQPSLTCRYEAQGGAVQCMLRDRGCPGGAPRPPQPLHWDFQPDYAPNGCPISAMAYSRRCKAPRRLKCTSICGGITQCIRGRWRQTKAPLPRP